MDGKDARCADMHLWRLELLLRNEVVNRMLGGRRTKDGTVWWERAVEDARWALRKRHGKDDGFDRKLLLGDIAVYEWIDDLLFSAETVANICGRDPRDNAFREKLKTVRDRLSIAMESLYEREKALRMTKRVTDMAMRHDEEPTYSEEECRNVRR